MRSNEEEIKVLGAILLDNESLSEIVNDLLPEYFSDKHLGELYRICVNLFSDNKPIDTINLTRSLRKSDIDPLIITDITSSIESSALIKSHAAIIIEKWVERSLINLSENIKENIRQKYSYKDILELTYEQLFKLFEIGKRKNGSEINQVAQKVVPQIESILKGEVNNFAIKTGYKDLDDKIIGLRNSDLIILAGRPSSGKTAFALNLMRNISKDDWTAIFSLEMSDESLYIRLLSSESKNTYNSIMTGRIHDKPGLSRSIHKINKYKIFIDDTPALSSLEMLTRARKLKRKYNIKALFVDYLQLAVGKGNSREQEISNITQTLKSIAKELDIPVIALSQLNRSVEQRELKKPQLSDLRESGAIEQEADLVLFMYRPEVYGLQQVDGKPTENLAQIIIGKQRNGIIGTVDLVFDKNTMTFKNIIKEGELPREPNEQQSFPI